MSRYHRDRKSKRVIPAASTQSSHTNATKTTKATIDKVLQPDYPEPKYKADNPLEYTTTLEVPVNRSRNETRDMKDPRASTSGKIIANEGSIVVERYMALPTRAIRDLQFCEPRVQESSRFIAVFQAYVGLLNDRQTPLDILSDRWLPTAFADPVLFHAILFNFSQHMYALCSVDHEKPSILSHKVQALRYISSRMDNPDLACSDVVFASILCLVSHELLVRDYMAIDAHVRGLRNITAIRGGVDALGLDGTLRTVYLGYELLLATVLKSWAPNLPPLDFILRPPTSPVHCNTITLTRDLVDLTIYGFDIAMIQLLQILERILSCHDILTKHHMLSDIQQNTVATSSLYRSKRALRGLAERLSPDPILASLQLTSILDPAIDRLKFPCLHQPSMVKERRFLVIQLKQHLNLTSLTSFWNPVPGVLLWCLSVGVNASKDTPEHPWFMANLMRTITSLAFANWEGVKSCLEQLSDHNKMGRRRSEEEI